jgi:acetamidase/formamidase
MKNNTVFFVVPALILMLSCGPPEARQDFSEGEYITLEASPETVAWGHYWSETPPVLRIKSGDRVRVRTLHVGNPETLEKAGLPPDEVEESLREVHAKVTDKGPGGHVLTGPIFIEGAEPGDMLEVRILSIDLAIPYAYMTLSPDRGFLSGEFEEPVTKIIRLDEAGAFFAEGIEVPLAPFFGSMGVAPPPEAGRWNSAPPWIHGGNMDNKELVAGSTLFLPVHVVGALFQVGDGHAAQGNGEVCITAFETSLWGDLQFVLHKNKRLEWPRAETPTHIISMGTDENLSEAAKIAVRQMIRYLMEEKGLSREDAYMLCSVAVDFNITQLVDGKVGVHGLLPKNLFQ